MRRSRRFLNVLAIVGCTLLTGCREEPRYPTLTPTGFSDAEMYPPDLPWPGPNFLDDRLAACPSVAEVASVTAVPLTFDASALTGPLVCRSAHGSVDLTAVQKRVYFALILMKELRFDRPLPWTTAPLFEWFLAAVPRVTIFGTEGVSRYSSSTGVTIHFAPPHEGELRWGVVETLIGGLVHEARHAEGALHSCESNTRDSRFAQNGAFAYHNQFLSWVGLHADPSIVPVAYRPHALLSACKQRNAAFCFDPKESCR